MKKYEKKNTRKFRFIVDLLVLYLTQDPKIFHWTQVCHAVLGAFETLSI